MKEGHVTMTTKEENAAMDALAVPSDINYYTRVKMDPFLCVTADGCPIYVIERWDEPTFRS